VEPHPRHPAPEHVDRPVDLPDAARLAAIVESSPSIMVALDTRYHLTHINGAARRILGLADEDVGRYLGDVIDPRRTPDTPERREELLSVLGGESVSFDTYLLGPDGSERTIDFTLAPILAPDGTVAGISAIGRDVTEARRAERQRRRLAAVVEVARDPILLVRPDGTVISWNRAAEEAFGTRAAEVLGRPLAEVLPPWLLGEELRLPERAARGEEVTEVEVTGARGGVPCLYAVSVFPIPGEGGELDASAIMVRDVTESRRLAEQLAQAQRLESLGRLAGGIAHDFNNLLAVISGYADVVAREVEDATATHAVREIERASRRAADLTSQLLAFSRRRPGAPRPVDVAATVRGLRSMLERLLGADVELIVAVDQDLPPVVADRAQLEQVVVNLAINARDAMPGGGTLRIEVESVVLEGDRPHAHLGLDPGCYVAIAVTDTGAGIPPELIDHVFEPFFTTKEVGQGTGLGLASVHGSVAQAGGHVLVESAPGAGSTFLVYLPAGSRDAPPARTAQPVSGPTAGGPETILLCEDEEALRALLERMLTRAGYRVVAAAEPAGARARAAELEGAYDAVVTDVVMPGGSGLELAETLRARYGVRPLLFISGYNAETVDRAASLPPGSAFLEKPFDSADLLATLRALLDGGQASSA
jgi:PAS domain S-box-containing protein